jgi:ribosomal protein S14
MAFTLTACPKPARGTAKLERIVRRAKADNREDANKTKVRKRDGHCRWPHLTPEDKELCRRTSREVAHLSAKGAGGDPQTLRSKPELMIALCRNLHQGPGSLHAGDRKVLYLTKEKANGPCAFLERRGPKWIEVARELWPGVLA